MLTTWATDQHIGAFPKLPIFGDPSLPRAFGVDDPVEDRAEWRRGRPPRL